MAGYGGRNRGKRSSSSSSYFSTITLVVFLGFCLFGLWMLTSSSVVPSHVIHNRHSGQRQSFESSVSYSSPPPPPAAIDQSSVASDDNTQGINEKIGLPREEEVDAGFGGGGESVERKEEEIQPVTNEQVELEGGGEESQRDGKEEKEGEEQGQEKSEGDGNEIAQQSNNEGGENKGELEKEGDVKQQEMEQQRNESENEEKISETLKVQTEGESEESSQQQEERGTSEENPESTEQTQTEQQREEPQETHAEEKVGDANEGASLPEDGLGLEVTNETSVYSRPWTTGADQSENEERRKEGSQSHGDGPGGELENVVGQNWELCNVTVGPDYIPCLDNKKALKMVRITGHYEHRERHCPEEAPKCLVPLPLAYKRPILWPKSRDKIWYKNVPSTKLAQVKGHQNWVKVTGEYLTFPGGGTQFIHGALHYIDFIQKAVPRIAWGKHTRVVLDVGCGVASFGGYLFERDVLTMSFAPKDEHEAQVQFALERGIPAISAVMGTQRLPFPSGVFDMVHCARCRVPWHADGGILLLELNRVLRPGGYFVWSATPVYQKLKEDIQLWQAMSALTTSMCWDLVIIKKDRLNGIGAAIYRKPVSNECYYKRKVQEPPMCNEDEDANAAWYVRLQSCMHKVPIHSSERGSHWPTDWPNRLTIPPYWINSSDVGIYGKPLMDDFAADFEHWKQVVEKSYLTGMDIDWSKIRNVMDMRAVYGGFAAALKDLNIWVMNVVDVDSDTLSIIYERGLFGIYHDWCESFSTYPRTYDLLHADHLLSGLKKRCDILPVLVEVDRILRPGGRLIVRDEPSIVTEVQTVLKSLHWNIRLTSSKGEEGILCARKTKWRPTRYSSSS